MTKRIFVALPISEKLQRKISEWEKDYSHLPVRWLEGSNLHITLVPPWEERNADSAISKLKEAAGYGQIQVRFNQVCYGPKLSEPRLIWAEGEAPRDLIILKNKLEDIYENRSTYEPWLMHLTLARFEPESFKNLPMKNLDEQVLWREIFDTVVIMETVRTGKSTDYHILARVSLNQ